ncbi:MAG: IS5/IS1182 family transposase, partial [Nitrososphaerota archaeon]|nr:IS5/IS1182 family transposase [Nitrososphaerota archaeon]
MVGYCDEKFRRITGVKRVTFEKMPEILRHEFAIKHTNDGRKPKLPIEKQLLATLEYIRKY